MSRKIIKFLFITGSIVFLSACLEDVSRDNPLDPASSTANMQITGQVLTFYHPREAIAQATILIEPLDLVVLTDNNGFFRFTDLQPGSYTVICSAEGYHTDSAQVNLSGSFEHTFLLDGLPQFERISLTAHHRSRWFPREEVYFIELEAEVRDPDGVGDIHSVVCHIPSINFSDTLQPEIEAGKFSSSLFDSDIPVESVHQLIGRQIYFVVEDDFQTQTVSEAKFLTRIIEQFPILLSPVELNPVETPTIDFQWERVSVPYPAELRIEIFHINLGIAFKTVEINGIPIESRNYTYSHDLDAGDYFWTLNIVDEFGNTSGSREGTFQIK